MQKSYFLLLVFAAFTLICGCSATNAEPAANALQSANIADNSVNTAPPDTFDTQKIARATLLNIQNATEMQRAAPRKSARVKMKPKIGNAEPKLTKVNSDNFMITRPKQ